MNTPLLESAVLQQSVTTQASCWVRVLHQPQSITLETDAGTYHTTAARAASGEHAGVQVMVKEWRERRGSSQITIASPDTGLKSVHLRWNFPVPCTDLRILGDAWERGYGDLHWGAIQPERVLPWYFMVTDSLSRSNTHGVGVRTQPDALCWWRVDPQGVSLWLDVRNGGSGVLLGERVLHAAEIVVMSAEEDATPFEAACAFCRALCENPRLPDHIVYGSNNWYYAYGDISTASVREDGYLISELTQGLANRPYMVIDDGWQKNARPGQFPLGGPWTEGNCRFPDMPGLAKELKEMGTRPGLWNRPLGANSDDAESLLLPGCRAMESSAQLKVLDPSIPEVLDRVEREFRIQQGWGYELLKHDWTTHDIFGRWGIAMTGVLTGKNWHFYDRSRTTAEIILNLYRAIRRGSGEAVIIGCNTIGHLSAGLFELQRTGDDTSGRNWERTRRMGINTLAFRMPQHNAFFAVDADCAGITRNVPWELSARWLDLLSRSGTPLFVSADPKAVGRVQRRALTEAFAQASCSQTIAEPLDWLDTVSPTHWRTGTGDVKYEWIGKNGIEVAGDCP
ncbi:MAG: hypothetical protein ACAI35_17595 [Candidatus Methylacidiphilales bacterium]|nr:hypothetical protein [Candidatus Methylacidiphilales bacterium]